ncbi:Tyrosyl-tRNA synthetase [Triticum urartu]|uniref:Tyrosine--tRNA ligase n=1 Tax=Triticum urartu TaxID=4572 RepID=M7Z289_TRIUA|nr:Tyrosyl-tRNA synthetase [Triticum urartu]
MMSKPDELQDDTPKFDAIPLCGIDDAESSMTLFQDGAATSTTTETLKDQALKVSNKVARKDDASILGGENDDVLSSAFIHGDNDEMVEHGIFPSTTTTFDDLSDFCHHIESESDFTTSPIYDVLRQFPCEESHNPHHLSEMSDSTICEIECTYFVGVSEPPHRESEIVDRSCEATFNTNDLTSTSIVSSHLVLGPLYDDAPILDDFVLPLDKMMAMVQLFVVLNPFEGIKDGATLKSAHFKLQDDKNLVNVHFYTSKPSLSHGDLVFDPRSDLSQGRGDDAEHPTDITMSRVRLSSDMFDIHFTYTKVNHLLYPCSLNPFEDANAAATTVRRGVVDVLRERGLVEATTSEALGSSSAASGEQQKLKVYCGFDPTAESLHLGNLLGLVALSWFRRCGHTAVALVGGATGRIGDPSGKSAERPELDLAAVVANSDAIKSLIAQILTRAPEPSHLAQSGKEAILDKHEDALANSDQDLSEKSGNVGESMGSFVILDNYDWWKDITLLDFLKEVGKFARVGTMIAKESVKKRLNSEDGMSYTEFTYQLLQGYDFLYMFKNMGVNVQIGGSDQWGNITAGTDLIRKILQVEGAHGLTFPLLLKSDGTKFGKTEDGAIWLSPKMLSPYKFYQYFFSVPDVDVVRFMKILTFLSLGEIHELEESMKKPGYVPNTVQRRLAEEVTRFVHGQEGVEEALKATEALRPGAQTQLDSQTIEGIADDVPSCSLPYDQVLKSPLVDLAASTGLLASKSAVRRLIKQGGLYLNNKKIDSEDKLVEEGDIVDGKVLLLSAGKKNKMVVRIS